MDLKDLTPEQMEKLKACKTGEEVLALAKAEGKELTDEQLEQVSGGEWNDFMYEEKATCLQCGKTSLRNAARDAPTHCPNCGAEYPF